MFSCIVCPIRREYRRTCETAGKSGKQIERCLISSFQIAESMGFKATFANGKTCCASEIERGFPRDLPAVFFGDHNSAQTHKCLKPVRREALAQSSTPASTGHPQCARHTRRSRT